MSIDDWTKIVLVPPATQLHTAIAYGNGKFVLVGAQTIKWSIDNGVSWGIVAGMISATFHGVAYGSGLFVAVGNLNGTSSDGISWPGPFTPYSDSTGTQITLRAVAYGIVSGTGKFVAVGDGRTIVTWDGTKWVVPPLLTIPAPPAVPATVDFTAITFGNGRFVVAGSNFTILTSPDGSSWTKATAPATTTLRGAAFGSAQFVGVTAGTAMTALLTSTNGSSWTSQGAPVGGLRGIAYGGQTFVAVGDTDRIYRSPDPGATWTNSNTTVSGPDTLNAVAYGNNGFVAVGTGGTILQSEFASLSALTCSAGPLTPAFSPGRTVYDVTSAGGSVTVTPTVADPLATIAVRFSSIGLPPTGSYSPVLSGMASAAAIVGWRLTTFEIKVTASNGATKTYTVGVHREFPVLLRWLSWFWIR